MENRWIECAETLLTRVVERFGAGRYLDKIGTADVQAWLVALGAGAYMDGRTLSQGTVRHHLNAVSNLYRRAGSEEAVPPGYNPAAAILETPAGTGRRESAYLEVHDGELLLEAAHRPLALVNGHPTRYAEPLVATFLLTGGRSARARSR